MVGLPDSDAAFRPPPSYSGFQRQSLVLRTYWAGARNARSGHGKDYGVQGPVRLFRWLRVLRGFTGQYLGDAQKLRRSGQVRPEDEEIHLLSGTVPGHHGSGTSWSAWDTHGRTLPSQDRAGCAGYVLVCGDRHAYADGLQAGGERSHDDAKGDG